LGIDSSELADFRALGIWMVCTDSGPMDRSNCLLWRHWYSSLATL
jgi:hypothetical protein